MFDKDYGHDCHYHEWGPHGPDGPMIPHDHAYEWPDIYHPVPYGKEYKGNENLTLDCGEHWCPPRDHGRHGCHDHHHDHCHSDPCHAPMTMLTVLGDYVETAQRLIDATTYQERCDCVDELRRIKVKMEKVLGEFDHELSENDAAVGRLQQKVTYYIGKMQEVLKAFDENVARQDELEQAVQDVQLLDFEDYYTKEEIDDMKFANPKALFVDGVKYDGSQTVEITTTQISRSGNTLVIR